MTLEHSLPGNLGHGCHWDQTPGLSDTYCWCATICSPLPTTKQTSGGPCLQAWQDDFPQLRELLRRFKLSLSYPFGVCVKTILVHETQLDSSHTLIEGRKALCSLLEDFVLVTLPWPCQLRCCHSSSNGCPGKEGGRSPRTQTGSCRTAALWILAGLFSFKADHYFPNFTHSFCHLPIATCISYLTYFFFKFILVLIRLYCLYIINLSCILIWSYPNS